MEIVNGLQKHTKTHNWRELRREKCAVKTIGDAQIKTNSDR